MSFFKPDPVKKLQKAYQAKQREAQNAQRSGDIQAFADLTQEANELFALIEAARRGA